MVRYDRLSLIKLPLSEADAKAAFAEVEAEEAQSLYPEKIDVDGVKKVSAALGQAIHRASTDPKRLSRISSQFHSVEHWR